MKKIILIGVFIFSAVGFSWAMGHCGQDMRLAQAETAAKDSVTQVKKAENAGNKICPVSGEAIDEKLKSAYEYEGKIYNFCCAMCIDDFKKDPQKYIQKVEEQKQKEEVNKNNK